MNSITMGRVWILTLALPLSGCIGTDFGDDLAEGASEQSSCVAASTLASMSSLFVDVRRGEENRVELVGLCSAFEACTEDSPLMLGSEHEVLLEALVPNAETVSFASTDQNVLRALDTGAACQFAQGTLFANAVGEAAITVSIDGEPADRLALAVSPPHALALSAPDSEEPAAPVLRPGDVTVLQATVRDADGRVLAAGDAIEWIFEDNGLLEVGGDDTGGGAHFIEARAPGTTTVRARVASFEAELVVTVSP